MTRIKQGIEALQILKLNLKINTPMNFVTKLVTPEIAKEILENNTGNRKVTQNHVDFLASQMKNGQFSMTGETIKISKTGNLIDGQHRLNAIIKSGVCLELAFCVGLEDEIFDKIDTGRTRTASDILSVKGFSQVNELASAVRTINRLEKKVKNEFSGTSQMSSHDILEFVNNNQNILEIVKWVCTRNPRFRMMSSGAIAALYYLFEKRDAKRVDEFFDAYYTGIGILDNNPIYVLRNRLIMDSTNKTKLKSIDKAIAMIHTWNLFVKNKNLKRFDFDFTKVPAIL